MPEVEEDSVEVEEAEEDSVDFATVKAKLKTRIETGANPETAVSPAHHAQMRERSSSRTVTTVEKTMRSTTAPHLERLAANATN